MFHHPRDALPLSPEASSSFLFILVLKEHLPQQFKTVKFGGCSILIYPPPNFTGLLTDFLNRFPFRILKALLHYLLASSVAVWNSETLVSPDSMCVMCFLQCLVFWNFTLMCSLFLWWALGRISQSYNLMFFSSEKFSWNDSFISSFPFSL